jgi:methionyl-tRNA formyltransferase
MGSIVRIIMLGTGDFALPAFEQLTDSGHDVVALLTQPERPQGRKQELIASRIKQAALARGIAVEQPEDVNAPASLETVASLRPDLLVTAAYGQILSPALLSIPPLGGINLHGSVLPAYRGAAPVARAIQRGETETGVTVIQMTPRIDAGGIIEIARTTIEADETAGQLEERLALLGAPLVQKAVAAIAAGMVSILPQDSAKVTKAPKLRKSDGLIDWTQPAPAIHNLVRAMQPWPAAYTSWRPPGQLATTEPLRLIVHQTSIADGTGVPGEILEAAGDRLKIAAGAGAVLIKKLQIPGKTAGTAAEFLRGHKIEAGERLST